MAQAPDPDQDFFGRSGAVSPATAGAQRTDGLPRQQEPQEQRRLHSLGSPSMQEEAEMDGAFTGLGVGVVRRMGKRRVER